MSAVDAAAGTSGEDHAQAIYDAFNELHRLGHVGQSIKTVEQAHALRDLADRLLLARAAWAVAAQRHVHCDHDPLGCSYQTLVNALRAAFPAWFPDDDPVDGYHPTLDGAADQAVHDRRRAAAAAALDHDGGI